MACSMKHGSIRAQSGTACGRHCFRGVLVHSPLTGVHCSIWLRDYLHSACRPIPGPIPWRSHPWRRGGRSPSFLPSLLVAGRGARPAVTAA